MTKSYERENIFNIKNIKEWRIIIVAESHFVSRENWIKPMRDEFRQDTKDNFIRWDLTHMMSDWTNWDNLEKRFNPYKIS